MREWKRSTPLWSLIAGLVLLLVFSSNSPAQESEFVTLTAAEVDSLAIDRALLLKDIEFWKAEADSLRLQVSIEEVKCAELEANQRHWTKRLAAIDRELETEPNRIRELYQVKAQRIEPIGLVYLWPITG